LDLGELAAMAAETGEGWVGIDGGDCGVPKWYGFGLTAKLTLSQCDQDHVHACFIHQ
jgi:hypothetical protein